MTYGESLLSEFDQEMANTRKVLERVPEDRLDWQAHPKSHTVGWVANHLADIPAWVGPTFASDSWDYHPPGGEPYKSPTFATRAEILGDFDRNVAAARATIASASDEAMDTPWTMLFGGQVLFTMPRRNVLRSLVLNHSIHHRAILCVYYRLLGVPVPGMYGPSGDE